MRTGSPPQDNQTTPASCRDEFDPNALSVEQARQKIIHAVQPIMKHENVPLRGALGRVLHADIVSPMNVPGHDYSAMDGYALGSQDLPETQRVALKCIGSITAGAQFEKALVRGECVRIMTGAKMPAGADTVVMQEQITRDGDTVYLNPGHHAGENVRYIGEDIAIGNKVLEQGRRLTPADLGLLASLGVDKISVRCKPRVAFFTTGNELKSIGEKLEPGQIYDSNRYTLHGLLQRADTDIRDLGIIADNKSALSTAFERAASQADMIISTGGVSVGDADYVKDVLTEMGDIHFWKIAMKPGRPLTFGKIKQAWFFGLPGNPVSAMVTFYIFVLPALRALCGQSTRKPLIVPMRCLHALKKRVGRADYQRGIYSYDENGNLVVSSTGEQGSGMLTSMSKANCFIVLPLQSKGVSPGEIVEVIPFSDLELF